MEKSESGSPIYRYNDKTPKQSFNLEGESSIEEITEHIEKYVGEIELVFHELVSDLVHIDVHWVKPSNKHPFHTFITSGMSDLPMNAPMGVEDAEYAELSICLPADWKISEQDFENEEYYWPIRWLKILARFPHQYQTWLSYGHTIPNGDPAFPFSARTKMDTMLLLPSITFPDEFRTLKTKDKTINFYTLIPIYQEEVQLKLKKGVEALFDGFDKHHVNDILNVSRVNTVKPKKRFGLF